MINEFKTVFIIGAGASRAAGAPLMYDFIDTATRIFRRREAGWAQESFKLVFDARKKLQVAFAKANVDLDNIENLFATFEMASLVGRLGNIPNELVEELPKHLRYLIMRTLEQSILFPISGDQYEVGAPYPYEAFVQLLEALNNTREVAPVAVISFNYDLCIEYALAAAGIPIWYGIDTKGPTKNAITVFKVHGSLNWTQDQDTKLITAKPVQHLPMKVYWDRFGFNESHDRSIDTMELMEGPGMWGEAIRPNPIIVPPTLNKGVYQEMLKPVWRNASSALASAENVFIMGYSLPPSDQFFRSFYSLSTISDAIIDRFWIFDPSTAPDISDRFRSMIGPAVRERNKFRHEQLKFSMAIKHVAELFGLHVSNALVDR